uniref:Amino acid transporter transmembrane domain-containing protein n=2 Tax=Lotharella globosa TaxID=91324 RepID=A0A7S3YTV1_9EUKA
MSTVVCASCIVAVSLYMILAVSGMYQFGYNTNEDILTNLGHNSPAMAITQLLMAANIGLSFPMNVYPSRFTLEMLLFSDAKPSAMRRYLMTLSFVGLAAIVAIAVPNITTVFSILGGSSAVLVSFVLPAAFYLHLTTGSLVSTQNIKVSILLAMAIIFGVVTTGSSIALAAFPELAKS